MKRNVNKNTKYKSSVVLVESTDIKFLCQTALKFYESLLSLCIIILMSSLDWEWCWSADHTLSSSAQTRHVSSHLQLFARAVPLAWNVCLRPSLLTLCFSFRAQFKLPPGRLYQPTPTPRQGQCPTVNDLGTCVCFHLCFLIRTPLSLCTP